MVMIKGNMHDGSAAVPYSGRMSYEQVRAVELFESGLLDTLEAGTFAALAEINRHLFDELYDFAEECATSTSQRGISDSSRQYTWRRLWRRLRRCRRIPLMRSSKNTWR